MGIQLFFDGACSPYNPRGHSSYGILIFKNKKCILKDCKYIGHGEGFSNNVAEYAGLQAGLEYLLEEGLMNEEIRVFGDSKLVINQMNREWGIKGGMYAWRAIKCKQLVQSFSEITFTWIPRELNDSADELSKKALKYILNK